MHFFSVKKHEIEKLIYMYQELVKNSPPSYKIDRSKFRDLLHQHFEMTDDILLDRGIMYDKCSLTQLSFSVFYFISQNKL